METTNPTSAPIRKKIIGSSVLAEAPEISIITPAYNCSEFIVETLDSVFSQTFKNFEIIIVNDGSSDTEELVAALKPFSDNIVYIEQANAGASVARNAAIRSARGEFLAFLDGDDIWLPNYLEEQMKVLKEKNCDMIYSDAFLIGEVSRANKFFSTKAPSEGLVTSKSLINAQCNVLTSGTVVKRECVVSQGMFDELLPRIGYEDFDLWFRLVRSGAKIDYHRQVLLKYRVRGASLSGGPLKIAERNILLLTYLDEKYDLSDEERGALRGYLSRSRAEYNVEKAKAELKVKNYEEAIRLLTEANKTLRTAKLSTVIFLLKTNPKSAQILFDLIRKKQEGRAAPFDRS